MSKIFTTHNRQQRSPTVGFWQKLVLVSIFSLASAAQVFSADAAATTTPGQVAQAASHYLHLDCLQPPHRPPGASLRALSSPLRASTLGGR